MTTSPSLTAFDNSRWSRKAREAYIAVLFYTDREKTLSILKELKKPVDIALIKLYLVWHYMMMQHHDKLLGLLEEVEDINKELGDLFIAFYLNIQYSRYYIGSMRMDMSIIDKDKGLEYLTKVEESINKVDFKDDYERYFAQGIYWVVKGEFALKMENDILKAIEYQKNCIDNWIKIPEDGHYYHAGGNIFLGQYLYFIAKFDEAEQSMRFVLEEGGKYNNFYQFWALEMLANINLMKGDIAKAKELNKKRLEVSKKYKSDFGIYSSLTQEEFLLFQEGEYDKALESCKESLVHREHHGDPLPIFEGKFNIFKHNYSRYKISGDKKFFEKAEEILPNLLDMSNTFPENGLMVNYSKYAQALIYKTGNMKRKVQAITILEDLIEFYPGEIGYSLDLLELLFEDAALTGDAETMQQIDELMTKIRRVPLRNNPMAIHSYISQQILLAKFDYYIKGDPGSALGTLRETREAITDYKLANLTQEIDREIEILERDITKWDHLDASVRERIKQSEFDKYIKEALTIMGKQV